ncbi:hypothetical protein BDZ90DRAFT_113427 [Jaminaea rosea]|uniref:Wax synthase domain-containing protein n=1 Tax=Jaminaea rosea TaxID=1569628 RepID=A0A316UW73_9BASI|nr:hypothetical protein BDZ90DRAFT_113427 [Jaminaea rosea]PWN29550.1 hypothetical protein BDZ90DRAFT_113427 [Jaminaea rosea]
MPLPRLSKMTWLSDFIAPSHCERRVPPYAILIVPYIVPLLQSWLLFHAPVAHKCIPRWALRHHAQTLRLALLPVQILLCLHISFAYSGWGLTFVFAVALSLAAKSIAAATRRQPPSLAHADEAKGRPARLFYFPHTKLPLFVDYVTSWRGAGWESGIHSEAGYGRPDSKGDHKSPPQTLTDPRTIAFLISRLKTFLCSAGLVAFALEVMRHPLFAAVFDAHPSILSPVNPLSSISPTRRVLVQTLFLLAQGISIPHPIQATFSLLSIISTLISPQTQTWWTPLPFDSPHLSTSLHDFWGKR